MSRNVRNYAKNDDEDKKDTINKLRAQIKQLEKYIEELKSENKTLVDAWAKTESFLEEVTSGIPLEEILKYKKLPRRALQKKAKADNKVNKQERERREVLEKWQKWNKERNNE
jgi:DNA-binding transcriptional MerR regulator